MLATGLITIVCYSNMQSPSIDTNIAVIDRAGMISNVTALMAFAGVFGGIFSMVPAIPIHKDEIVKGFYP